MSRLETAAKIEWQRWGSAYAKFTICTNCGESKHCRGTRKNKMLCLRCFDEGAR